MPILYGGEAEQASSYVCPMHPEVTASEASSCPKCGMKLVPADKVPGAGEEHERREHEGGEHAHDHADGLEWEDLMPEINRQTNTSNMIWQLIDQESGAENAGITWAFRVGDRIKIRLANEMDQEHPMHHRSTFTARAGSWFSAVTANPRPTSSGRTPSSCALARRSTSCLTSPIPACGWLIATSPSTPRAG